MPNKCTKLQQQWWKPKFEKSGVWAINEPTKNDMSNISMTCQKNAWGVPNLGQKSKKLISQVWIVCVMLCSLILNSSQITVKFYVSIFVCTSLVCSIHEKWMHNSIPFPWNILKIFGLLVKFTDHVTKVLLTISDSFNWVENFLVCLTSLYRLKFCMAWMMLSPLSGMSYSVLFQPHCNAHLEDTCSLENHFSISLFLQTDKQYLYNESI